MITITRFLPRSHDFLTISHDFLRSAARLAVAVLAALLIAAPSVSEAAPPSWVWLYSSDRCSYYLNPNQVVVDDDGVYHYAIKTVYVDDAVRQRHIASLSRFFPSDDFSDFCFDITAYHSYTGTNPFRISRNPVHMYCYRSDGSLITRFNFKPDLIFSLRRGSVDEIVDLKARSWAVYRSHKPHKK